MEKEPSVDTFYLDKVHENCRKAQERVGEASTALLVLAATLSLLAFSGVQNENVSLPILGISLHKWPAVEVLSALVCIAMYRMISLICYSRILRFRLSVYLDRIDEQKTPMWPLMYPSDYLFHIGIADKISRETGMYRRAFMVGYAFVGCILPLVILVMALFRDGFSFWGVASIIIASIVLIMTLVLYGRTPEDRASFEYIEAQLARTDPWRYEKTIASEAPEPAIVSGGTPSTKE